MASYLSLPLQLSLRPEYLPHLAFARRKLFVVLSAVRAIRILATLLESLS